MPPTSRLFRRVLPDRQRATADPQLGRARGTSPSRRSRAATPVAIVCLAGSSLFGLAGSPASAEPAACHITVAGSTVTAVDCPEDSHIATYRYRDGAPGPDQFDTSLPQTLSSTGNKTATTPDCFWQADVYTGDTLPVIDANHQYGARLLAFRHGGTTACAPPPPPTTPALPAAEVIVTAPAPEAVVVTPKLAG